METNERWSELIQIIIADIIRGWKAILLCILLFGSVADITISLLYVPRYRSEATFAIKSNNQYATSTTMEETGDIASAFSYIISSNVFKQKYLAEINDPAMDGQFETSMLGNTNIIRISATSLKPNYSYQMMTHMIEHYHELSELVLGNVNIELMQNISIPQKPYNRISHPRNFIKFGMVGGVLCIFVIGMMSYLQDTAKTKEDMEQLQIPSLGYISKESKWFYKKRIKRKKSILISQLSTSFRYIEEIKKIRTRIENKCAENDYKVIMVTSSLENEGKTSVLSNLGLALAQNNKKVLLIDADLRKPALYKIFDMEKENGIKKVIDKKHSLESAIIHSSQQNLDLLLAQEFEHAGDTLDNALFYDIIMEARDKYDYVLVDSVPTALFTDSIAIAKMCDAQILVVRQNYAGIQVISDTLDKLHLSRTPILGYVMNQKRVSWIKEHSSYSGYSRYGRYGYGYGKSQSSKGGVKDE